SAGLHAQRSDGGEVCQAGQGEQMTAILAPETNAAAPWQCVQGLVGPSLLVSVHNKVNRLKQPPPVTSLFHQKP
ncbi:unnamed protein product, partial [Rangifer tarandus platyrhynchus]